MNDAHATRICELFAEQCRSCRLCRKDCDLLQSTELTPQTIARNLLAGEITPELIDVVQRCAICGFCSRNCPFRLNPGELMQAARIELAAREQIRLDDYQLMLVDQPVNFFNLFRETWEVSYRDLERDDCATLFFPGCSLSSYAPELTRRARSWLAEEQAEDIGFSARCCGLPLFSIGLKERAETYLAGLENDFAGQGVQRLVTACPNCFYFLREHLREIEVCSLYQLMVEAGVKIPGRASVAVHDSCPDRFSGEVGRSMRGLLEPGALEELPHHGPKTLCCGAGGIVSMIDPAVSAVRAQHRRMEIENSATAVCISACMACVKRLSAIETAAPESGGSESKIRHLLELVFDCRIDHAELDHRLAMMWRGQRGERNLQRLQAAASSLDNPSATEEETS